jgi:hypothetical protein
VLAALKEGRSAGVSGQLFRPGGAFVACGSRAPSFAEGFVGALAAEWRQRTGPG